MIRIRRPRLTIGAIMFLIAAMSVPIALEARRRREEARAQQVEDAIIRDMRARKDALDRANADAARRLQELEARERAAGTWIDPPANWQELVREARERARRRPEPAEDGPHVQDLFLREKPSFRQLATREPRGPSRP